MFLLLMIQRGEVKECIRILSLFTEKKLKKAFFSYGSAIPKRTPRYITLILSMNYKEMSRENKF